MDEETMKAIEEHYGEQHPSYGPNRYEVSPVRSGARVIIICPHCYQIIASNDLAPKRVPLFGGA